VPLHENFWPLERREAEFLVKAVRITGREYPTPHTLELRMTQDALHQPLRETLPAVFRQHEEISKIRDCRVVRNHASKSNLAIAVQQRET
jgi:hypothetical protein